MAVEVKICGLTDPVQALACVEAGATAIGFVFHPPSPRHLTLSQAVAIARALPSGVARVGVFAESDGAAILEVAEVVGLTSLQLHGHGSMAALPQLCASRFHIVAVLRTAQNLLAAAKDLPQGVSLLVECGKGVLPGGNGVAWDWAASAPLAGARPFALAGGITPANVVEALRVSKAAAVDVSSGVESSPGQKDISLVRSLLSNLQVTGTLPSHQIFR